LGASAYFPPKSAKAKQGPFFSQNSLLTFRTPAIIIETDDPPFRALLGCPYLQLACPRLQERGPFFFLPSFLHFRSKNGPTESQCSKTLVHYREKPYKKTGLIPIPKQTAKV